MKKLVSALLVIGLLAGTVWQQMGDCSMLPGTFFMDDDSLSDAFAMMYGLRIRRVTPTPSPEPVNLAFINRGLNENAKQQVLQLLRCIRIARNTVQHLLNGGELIDFPSNEVQQEIAYLQETIAHANELEQFLLQQIGLTYIEGTGLRINSYHDAEGIIDDVWQCYSNGRNVFDYVEDWLIDMNELTRNAF